MEYNISQHLNTTLEGSGMGLQMFFVVPELFNLVFLILGIFGMYRGIEIQHPLYAILFFNLIVPLITSSINITAFGFLSSEKYVRLSNLTNALSVYFHGTCWLLSSMIRYLYILHNDWLFSKVPDLKNQCWIAIGLEIVLTFILMMPILVTAILLGNYETYLQRVIKVQ